MLMKRENIRDLLKIVLVYSRYLITYYKLYYKTIFSPILQKIFNKLKPITKKKEVTKFIYKRKKRILTAYTYKSKRVRGNFKKLLYKSKFNKSYIKFKIKAKKKFNILTFKVKPKPSKRLSFPFFKKIKTRRKLKKLAVVKYKKKVLNINKKLANYVSSLQVNKKNNVL